MPSFKKADRLKSKKQIARLFDEGKTIRQFPLSCFYIVNQKEGHPLQTAISVPRKKFPKAVDRNRIKRLIKESYRLNKESLYCSLQNNKLTLQLILIYNPAKHLSYNDIDKSVKRILQKLESSLAS